MLRVEYATTVQQNHPIVIPQQYTKNISDGSKVRIYIHVDEPADIAVREKEDQHDDASFIDDLDLTLEEFTEKLRSRPYPEHLIKRGDGRLAEYLVNPVAESDSDSDVDDYDWVESQSVLIAK